MYITESNYYFEQLAQIQINKKEQIQLNKEIIFLLISNYNIVNFYKCGATKLECTFDYEVIMSNYVLIIVYNYLIIVSASDIPTDD
jgi:hypothetical protein